MDILIDLGKIKEIRKKGILRRKREKEKEFFLKEEELKKNLQK